MRRRLFTFAAAVSAVLLVATVALWVRSYWRADEVTRLTPGWGHYFGTARGQASFYASEVWLYPRAYPEWSYDVYPDTAGRKLAMDQIEQRVAEMPANGFRRLGFAFRHRGYSGAEATVVIVPMWAPAAVFAVSPVLWACRRKRAWQGLCRECGYDLRASPDRCPECGTPVATKQPAPA